MKRGFFIAAFLSTFFLFSLVIYRIAKNNGNIVPYQPTPEQTRQYIQTVNSSGQIETHSTSSNEFIQDVQSQVGTNLDSLSGSERAKLFACIERFYACYSTGSFNSYKEFRLRPPFVLNSKVASYFKKIATSRNVQLVSDEDVLRYGWNYKNGTNKISGINKEKITLTILQKHDVGSALELRQPTSGRFPGSGASCWEGFVNYQPSLPELLKREVKIRFFKLEFYGRFELADGPATPLVFTGYWDSERNDWMPLTLCTSFHVGNYDTIF